MVVIPAQMRTSTTVSKTVGFCVVNENAEFNNRCGSILNWNCKIFANVRIFLFPLVEKT